MAKKIEYHIGDTVIIEGSKEFQNERFKVEDAGVFHDLPVVKVNNIWFWSRTGKYCCYQNNLIKYGNLTIKKLN